MKTVATRKTVRRTTHAVVLAPCAPGGSADAKDFALVKSLMEMQCQMMEFTIRLPQKSMFDGIPKGASPYYFDSMLAERL